MLKKCFILFCCLTVTVTLLAQEVKMPDFDQFKNRISSRLDLTVKPPVKDIERLRLLPSQPPSRTELVNSLQQSAQQIQQGIPAPRIEEIKQAAATLPVETINEKAIMEFYSEDPKGAVLMMMETAARAPDSLLVLNNLGAMLNLQGAAHKAIPILQYCQQKLPGSSIVLNNIGQSFMALGDLLKAANYFNQCLSIDSLNIEANHSMGMLHYFKKEYDAAMTYFEREMSVAIRSTTMAMAYKMGKKFNIRAIMKRKQRRSGQPQKDHFEEITLGKFSFPQLPHSAKQIVEDRYYYNTYGASVQAEQMTWMGYANKVLASYTAEMGNEHHGLYSELVNAMLEELSEEFTPEYLSAFTDKDFEHIQEMVTLYTNMLIKMKCPDVPAGSGFEAQEAFEIKCCRELLQPVADKMINEIGSYVQPIIRKGEARWKSYINQLVEIVQLDPTISNKALVYHAVAGYFNYLSTGMISFPVWEVQNLLPKCFDPRTNSELDSLVESDRAWKVSCPPWLNAEVNFGGMVVKVDCNKYVIEAGSSMMGAFEHEFKSGNSTLLFGPATKAEFLGLTAELKSQLYITFDGNKQFADFGIKNTGELGLTGTPLPIGPRIKLGGNLAGIEVSNTLSINGGYNHSVETKGALAL